ncbi:MAG TPA: UbiD family decarboxylase [Candidatus Lustribacter sp.]
MITDSRPAADLDRFRLRTFLSKVAEIGELETVAGPTQLCDVSARVESSSNAVLFNDVGPERYQMVGGVAASRLRIAAAFGVPPEKAVHEMIRRLANPQGSVEIASADAPVHAKVITGADIDLTTLPFHLQHQYDGGLYISTGIDFTIDPQTGRRNIGCRRLMLRSKNTMRANLTSPSDLKRMLVAATKRGERLPCTFVVGSGPLDFLAATQRISVDEFDLIGALRGEPVPLVNGVTNGIPVPADAEMTIEGYFDELGHRELEGPFGEFYGFYGGPHVDPVFHVTAITRRADVLYQTLVHGCKVISHADGSHIASMNTEVGAWRALRALRLEPHNIHASPASNGRPHLRVSLTDPAPGQARAVISALFALPVVKQVVVVNDDVDVRNDDEVMWATCSRFRADRDLVISEALPANYSDPMSIGRTVAKIGFDCTKDLPPDRPLDDVRAISIVLSGERRVATLREALADGPRYFSELMVDLGSRDGREIAIELDGLREAGVLERTERGQWYLNG